MNRIWNGGSDPQAGVEIYHWGYPQFWLILSSQNDPLLGPQFQPPVWSIHGPISLCPSQARTQFQVMHLDGGPRSCLPSCERFALPWSGEPIVGMTPESWYLKGIGSVASSLPLDGPDKWSTLEFFEVISVWAETAHFQLPTPTELWRGHISGSDRSWELPLMEHGERLSVGLGAPWFRGNRLWLGGTPSPIGRVSGSGLSRVWVVFEPLPLPATERVGPGIGI